MVASLLDAWTLGADTIDVRDDACVAVVRAAVRERGGSTGLSRTDTEALVTAASELAHNQLRHVGRGVVAVRAIRRGDVDGVEVIAADRGRGIADPVRALEGGGLPEAGLGVGLAGARRLADELDIDTRMGEGTCVVARKLAGPGPRFELAIVGRPHPAERVSGDDAAWAHGEDGPRLVVVDGLGHGPRAREASEVVAAVMRSRGAREGIEALLGDGESALSQTRGAVASIVVLAPGSVAHAGVGNVTTQLYSAGGTRRFVSAAGVLGRPGRRGRALVERVAIEDGATIVMFTDGISSRVDLASEPALLRRPALVVAHAVLQRHARDTDDALVFVARVKTSGPG